MGYLMDVFIFTAFSIEISVGKQCRLRALDKREYLVIIRDNLCQFCTKTYVVTLHLNHLNETVQMKVEEGICLTLQNISFSF